VVTELIERYVSGMQNLSAPSFDETAGICAIVAVLRALETTARGV
jgi:hypothetical protein